jgi:uncharacterized protein with PIN domain
VSPFTGRLEFHGDLTLLLKSKADVAIVQRKLAEKTSVKDIIESCGVPHPEVDLIVVKGRPVDFSFQLEHEQEIDVYPMEETPTFFPDKRLQVSSLLTFVADGHLGKLVRDLRLLGIDVRYDNNASDAQLLVTATTEDRALLTRDRRLLMHAVVRHGYCPRSHLHEEQTLEVIERFDLAKGIMPFTRCVRCNGPLAHVEKDRVLDQLEPLTRLYYEDFRRCAECGRVYWSGSHFGKLEARIERIRNLVCDR